jgi:D-alanyl-D-alanine carboxypeptidase
MNPEDRFSHPSATRRNEFDYCNTNVVLLGLVIEQLTGMSAAMRSASGSSTPNSAHAPPAANDCRSPFRTRRAVPHQRPDHQQLRAVSATAGGTERHAAAMNQTNANPSGVTAGGGI